MVKIISVVLLVKIDWVHFCTDQYSDVMHLYKNVNILTQLHKQLYDATTIDCYVQKSDAMMQELSSFKFFHRSRKFQ